MKMEFFFFFFTKITYIVYTNTLHTHTQNMSNRYNIFARVLFSTFYLNGGGKY